MADAWAAARVAAPLVKSRAVDADRRTATGLRSVNTVLRDLTDQKAKEEAPLEFHADHDPLTGLPTRVRVAQQLQEALRNLRVADRHVAVLVVDMDNFTCVNDSLGHETGDKVLIAVTARLAQAVRNGDIIGRFGGDEFLVVCHDVSGPDQARSVAERLMNSLLSPIQLVGGVAFHPAVSIGIALADAGASAEDLIRDADAAMYCAKELGRNRCEVFQDAMRVAAKRRVSLESALRKAVEERQFQIVYQPVCELDTGQVRGVEALVRWNHPERGLIAPKQFLEVAEETGMAIALGEQIMRQSCSDIAALESLDLSVNLSGRQFADPTLHMIIERALSDSGLAPGRLCLEINESVLMRDVGVTAAVLERLRRLGVALAVDDFGTGYSSLSQFPVDVLKIDRSFIDGLGTEREDSEIVRAIIGLAHALHLATMAEGVETEAQRLELLRLGCTLGQGFFFAKGVTIETLADAIRGGPSREVTVPAPHRAVHPGK